MKTYKGYLLDLDGTVYFGQQRIPTAEAFVRELIVKEVPFLFVTNNATRSPEEVAHALRTQYDLPVGPEHVYTSALAIIDYLREHHTGQSVYVVGEHSLHAQIKKAGFASDQTPSAQVVVQALNRQTTYEELALASLAIRNGAAFLVTNTDSNIPTERGMMPSSGALTAFLQKATQKNPIVMGKPHRPILDGALKRMGLSVDEVLMVGDNYETDIKVGLNAGMDTLLVLTGFTQREDLANVSEQPTYIRENLSQWDI